MKEFNVISSLALIIAMAAFIHSIWKSEKEERRAKRDDERIKKIEEKQKEEEERRFRADAPFLVATKLLRGTKDGLDQVIDTSRLIVRNEGQDCRCLKVRLRGLDIWIEPDQIPKGGKAEIIYPQRCYKKGTKVEFEIDFETSSGSRNTHKYEFGVDEVQLRRTYPEK